MKIRLIEIAIVLVVNCVTIYSQNIQPEYTSFESVSSSDNVSLLTGDFTYSLPIVNVPGPSGGFTASLSYHAGIRYDQEASWVGLGWNLNCGAITRNLSYYPDDYQGQSIYTHLDNPGSLTWVNSWLLYNSYFDSEKGKLGASLSLFGVDFTWGKEMDETIGIIGITANLSKGTVSADAEEVALTIVNAACSMIDAGITETASQTAIQIKEVVGTIKDVASRISDFYSKYKLIEGLAPLFTNYSSNSNLWTTHEYTKWFSRGALFRRFKHIYLNVGITENAFGTLYLSKLPHTAGSGIFYNTTDSYNTYSSNQTSDCYRSVVDYSNLQLEIKPISIAADKYNVMANGISGDITPYRFDIPSLAPPDFGESRIKRVDIRELNQDYVRYIYAGDAGNSYLHHIGDGQDIDVTDYPAQFGMSYSTVGPKFILHKDDVNLVSVPIEDNNRVGYVKSWEDWNGNTRNVGFNTGRHIAHYTNDDLIDIYDNVSDDNLWRTGLLDYSDYGLMSSKINRKQFRIDAKTEEYDSETHIYSGGLAAFSITDIDGTTYHFALPVYNNYMKAETQTGTSPSITTSVVENKNKFASAWLLTGITGPDYIDRGVKGIIDDQDWGHWVKFIYNKRCEDYYVRNPKSGYLSSIDGETNSYSETKSQRYYLESIQTKTHAALFIKGLRQDGYSIGNSLLRLNHIVLLSKKDFNALYSSYSYQDITNFCNGTTNTAISNYLISNQIKRTTFEYDGSYPLCRNTPDNIAGNGKLTLIGIKNYFKDNADIIPGFIFQYSSNNPSFDVDKFDGWNMYNPDGTSTSRTALGAGDEWCLEKVISPQGSEMSVEYERDDYNSISGINIPGKYFLFNDHITMNIDNDYLKKLSIGDQITIHYTGWEYMAKPLAGQQCPVGQYDGAYGCCGMQVDKTKTVTVTNISGSNAYFTPVLYTASPDPANCLYLRITSGTIEPDPFPRKGGDNRVTKIKISDGSGKSYETKYVYTLDGTEKGTSSGVCAVEPELCESLNTTGTPLEFKSKMLEYPQTPVLYGKVTVLNDFDGSNYLSKKVYEFETPHHEMVNIRGAAIDYDNYCSDPYLGNFYYYLIDYIIDVNTSKIGAVKNIYNYYNGSLTSSEQYSYINSHNSTGGIYTQGNLLGEEVFWQTNDLSSYRRVFRTTQIFNPYILKSVITNNSYGTIVIENDGFDYLTGIPSEKITTVGTKTIKTVSVPAYKIYPEMGPKCERSQSFIPKNMLSQVAVSYKFIDNGSSWAVSDANVQTWHDTWSAVNGNTTENQTDIWRKHKTFIWKGDINDDGTYNSPYFSSTGIYSPENIILPANWDDFDGEGMNGWQKIGELTKYNVYSLPLEAMDINGNYTASKTNYDMSFTNASVSNANYNEFAYAGAEEDAVSGFVGGNVKMETGTMSTAYNHTGNRSLLVSSGNKGFSFLADVSRPRTYKVSVWVKGTSADYANAQIGYGTSTAITSEQFQAGNWFLVSGTADIASSGTVSFYCKASGKNLYFDDFRVQPVDAPMSATVYDNRGNVSAVLDNDNFAVKYVYDDADKLKEVWKETPQGFEKVSSQSYGFSREP